MIEVKSNVLFLSTFGVKIDVKNERKRVSRMCENVYLSIKNPKASRALKWALDPGCRLLTSLARLRFATSATFGLRSWDAPLTKSWIRTWEVTCKCESLIYLVVVLFKLSKFTYLISSMSHNMLL